MPKRLEYRNYFAIATVIAVLVALVFSFHIHLPLRKTLLSKYTIAEDVSPLTFVPKRRSLLIIGRGRSGTSFVSKMLANGERIFEVYEPLRYHNLTDAQKLQVLQAFHTSEFTPSTLWEKTYFPPFWYLNERSYFIKPRENLACVVYRNGLRRCYPADILVQRFIDKCKRKYDITVVKELTNRLPGRTLSSVVPLLIDPAVGADIRLLHVVRDPRASINSRIKLKWFPEYGSPYFEQRVQDYCHVIFQNIAVGKALSEAFKHKYKLVFYRDIAARPFDTAKEIFKFAGLEMTEKTLHWITNMTNPDKREEMKESRRPYSLVRDSEANIDKWRSESPPERTRIIEEICQPLIKLLEKISFEQEYILSN